MTTLSFSITKSFLIAATGRSKAATGGSLPNPFQTGDLKGQTLVTQRDPELAK
jgi:hypothetical protein